MKKKHIFTNGFVFYCLVILFLFALNSNISAQAQGDISFGIKTGLASGTFSTQNSIGISSPRNGLQAGLFGDYNITDFLGVTLEVMYSNTGASNVDPEYFYSVENAVMSNKIINSSIVSQQVSIPLLISYMIPNSPKGIVPKIYVGGDIGFNLMTNSLNTYETSFNGNTIYNTKYESMGNRLAKNDFGAIMGTAISIHSNKLIYSLDARYRMGLSDINETTSSYVDSSIKRDVFSIMVGVAFKL